MYKKLTKLRTSLDSVLKLAELYTQQGLFNDARQQYLQVAEEFLRSGELEQAVRIFQKTLEMDPENVAMKVRLAEVYIRLGKKNEAWQIFSSAADQLRARGQLAPAEDILQRMLTLDPKNSQALLLRGRNALETGDSAAAIQYLQQVPNLDSHVESLKTLFQAYLASDRLSEAGVLATKLLSVHNDVEGLSAFVDALMKGGLYQDALNVYNEHAERLMAANQAKLLENLHTIIGHVRTDPDSLNVLLELFAKAGETTHLSEVTELLAHASVQTGNLPKARELYQQLIAMEPQNPIHAQNLQQVSAKLGDSPKSEIITAEEGAVIVDELEATAPSIDQSYDDAVFADVRAALTDAELFVSYNMPAKALGPLMGALPKAPTDIRLNQRLAALHTRAGRFAEAAICCRALERVYLDHGYADEAGRYGDLARRYEQRSGTSAASSQTEEAATAAPWPVAASASTEAPEFELPAAQDEPVAAENEIDLSDEWEGVTEEPIAADAPVPVVEEDAPAAPREDLVPETVEEIRFYVQHAMRLQALAALAKLEALTKDQSLISSLRAEYEAAFTPAAVAEPTPEASAEVALHESEAPEAAEPQPEDVPALERQQSEAELNQLVADLESSLGDGFDHPAAPGQTEPEPAGAVEVASSAAHGDMLGEFVADLEASLGDEF